jgi:hypothetical protein
MELGCFGPDRLWRFESTEEFDSGCVQEQRTLAFLTEEHTSKTLALCILTNSAEGARSLSEPIS